MLEFLSAAATLLLGASAGWAGAFVWVFSATAYRNLDGGRAERLVKAVMKAGHGHLSFFALLGAVAAGLAGAFVTAALAIIAAFCFAMCLAALAPRTDKPIRGHRVLRTARVTASLLTAGMIPILLLAVAFLGVRI